MASRLFIPLLLLSCVASRVAGQMPGPISATLGTQWDVLAPLPALVRGRHDDYLSFSYIDSDTIIHRNLAEKVASDTANGGYATWKTVNASTAADGTVTVSRSITEMDADLLTSFFGIAGTEMTALYATSLSVPVSGLYRFAGHAPDNFFIDRLLYRAEPQMVEAGGMVYKLDAGSYTFWTLFADWANTSKISVAPLQLVPVGQTLFTAGPRNYLPDVVSGRLASRLFSVNIISSETLFPWDLTAEMSLQTNTAGSIVSWKTTITKRIEALQPFQLALPMDVPADLEINYCGQPQLKVVLRARSGASIATSFELRCQNYSSPYRFVFEDVDGSAQYAMLWSPATEKCPERGCPVIRAYHGNGVESDKDAWTYSYKRQLFAWILMPTNRDKNGYDWETSGSINGWKALEALGRDLPGVPERLRAKVKADTNKVLYTGHSMGGHGTMATAVHHPDLSIGMVPMSGWLKHSIYVPDYIDGDFSHLDHHARGILENAAGDSDDDLLVSNAVGIPAFIRYGDADDNVPPLSLRRWHRLLQKFSGETGSTAPITLDEVPVVGHWFDDIILGPKVQAFFDSVVANGSAPRPALPSKFTCYTLNPSTSGSRGGIKILQTRVTGRMASFTVDRLPGQVWDVKTDNVALLQVSRADGLEFPENGLIIEGTKVQGEGIYHVGPGSKLTKRDAIGAWERSPVNYGPGRQVFETGPFWIVYAEKYRHMALWFAQEVFARGRFSPELRPEYLFEPSDAANVNMVVIGSPPENKAARWLADSVGARKRKRGLASNMLVQWTGDGFTIGPKTFKAADQGIVYLTPMLADKPERLALVVAGNSAEATEFILRYIPGHSEKRMPDYLVCDKTKYWQGLGACRAGGFWDSSWNFDSASSYGVF